VASTVLTTLLVTGGLVYLLAGREPPAPAHGAAPPVAVSPAPPSIPKPTGPGIRPIRGGEPEVLDQQTGPGTPPSAPADDIAPPAGRGTEASVGDLETEDARRVRAARLDKRRKYMQPKPTHGKRAAPSSKAPRVATAPATVPEPSPQPSSSEAPSSAPPPAAPKPPATDPASKVVDGRVIRTSL